MMTRSSPSGPLLRVRIRLSRIASRTVSAGGETLPRYSPAGEKTSKRLRSGPPLRRPVGTNAYRVLRFQCLRHYHYLHHNETAHATRHLAPPGQGRHKSWRNRSIRQPGSDVLNRRVMPEPCRSAQPVFASSSATIARKRGCSRSGSKMGFTFAYTNHPRRSTTYRCAQSRASSHRPRPRQSIPNATGDTYERCDSSVRSRYSDSASATFPARARA